jgi:uncharacterized protein (TIGR02246 family)
MRPALLLLGIITLSFDLGCRAGQVDSSDSAIRKLIHDFAAAEDHHDGKAIAALFTTGGQVSIQGRVVASGSDQIAESVAPKIPWSERFGPVYTIRQIRMVNGRNATVDAERVFQGPVLKRSSSTTFVVVKLGPAWRVSSYQDAENGTDRSPDPVFGSR